MGRLILKSLVAGLALAAILAAAPARAQTFSTPWMHATQGDWATEWGIPIPSFCSSPDRGLS